ncbi:unnamed protein product [Chondrus crispus]|uniref:Uncharacterized protein n=1 Tax=Chondrus crispus TaxID=2769 RepID=R7QGQ4_CHOCR|nr:unnamed protein product [Chondrus crispus]CDF36590.1 unnamed protein product [Chondrus crispus]|eukprot:XP_005716409.1 unnamed protein product [Chondrus crispus]
MVGEGPVVIFVFPRPVSNPVPPFLTRSNPSRHSQKRHIRTLEFNKPHGAASIRESRLSIPSSPSSVLPIMLDKPIQPPSAALRKRLVQHVWPRVHHGRSHALA